MSGKPFLIAALWLSPAFGEDAVRDLQVDVEEGPPAKVRFRGRADVADRVVLTLRIQRESSNTHGLQKRLMDLFLTPVKGGAFDKTFTLPDGLPSGAYRLEVECDRDHQRAGVRLPAGTVHGESSFKVDFTEDIAAPAEACAGIQDSLEALWKELEAEYLPLSSRLKDPKAIEEWNRFQESFVPRLSKLAAQCPGSEDLLYQDLRLSLNLVWGKIGLFREEYEALITTGTHCERYKPEWFATDPAAELVRSRDLLAREFAFNAGKRVVDYGYDKATGILAGLKGVPPDPAAVRRWEAFRTRFGQDLDRIGKTHLALAAGPCKDAFLRIAPDVPVLLKAGQELLAAGDVKAADPGNGGTSLEAVKGPLRKAYQDLQKKIQP